MLFVFIFPKMYQLYALKFKIKLNTKDASGLYIYLHLSFLELLALSTYRLNNNLLFYILNCFVFKPWTYYYICFGILHSRFKLIKLVKLVRGVNEVIIDSQYMQN